MKLSENFSLEEIFPKDFKPTQIQMKMVTNLVINILEPLREFAQVKIIITSGCRTLEDAKRLIAQGYHPSEVSDHFYGQIVPLSKPELIKKYGKAYAYSVGAVDCQFKDLKTDKPVMASTVFEKLKPKFRMDYRSRPYIQFSESKKPEIGQIILEKNGGTEWIHISNPFTLIYSIEFLKILNKEPFLSSIDGGTSYQKVNIV